MILRENLHKGGPLKSLCFGQARSGGRNNNGRITAARKGGNSHRKVIRIIDSKRNEFWNIPGEVIRLERDPGRTGRIALIKYIVDANNNNVEQYRYIVCPDGLQVGSSIIAGDKVEPNVGNAMKLKDAPQGTVVHNLELYPGKGAQICRSAGAGASITGRDGDFVILKLRSGELRRFNRECLCTIGEVSNKNHSNEIIGKAGRNRWLGRRPSVRGIAKNPVDHAMGGRTDGGRVPCTWDGKPTRGLKTRNPKKLSNRYIVKGRVRK